MPVKPKIYGVDSINKLKYSYIDKKMSTTDISKNSVEIFGIYVSPSTIYYESVKPRCL